MGVHCHCLVAPPILFPLMTRFGRFVGAMAVMGKEAVVYKGATEIASGRAFFQVDRNPSS